MGLFHDCIIVVLETAFAACAVAAALLVVAICYSMIYHLVTRTGKEEDRSPRKPKPDITPPGQGGSSKSSC